MNRKKDPIIARNPFWMKDDAWKETRSLVMAALTPIKLKVMHPLVLNGAENLVNYIKHEITIERSKAFDAKDICARYTCDTISSCTFGTDAKSFTTNDPFMYNNGKKMV